MMVNKQLLSTKFKSLLDRLYLKSIDYAKAYGTWRNTKRFHDFGFWPTICNSRYRSSNDFFWRELLSEQESNEYNGTQRETLPEWLDIINYLKNDPNKKIEDSKIEWAIGNFCIDILSNIITFNLQTPKIVYDLVDNKIDKFINDVFSDNLIVDFYIPLYNLKTNNNEILLQNNKKIIKKRESLPLDSREEFVLMMNYKKIISRNDFYKKNVVSDMDKKEIQDIINAITLYETGLPYIRSIYYTQPYNESEEFIIHPINLDTNKYIINVPLKKTKNFRVFIKMLIKNIDNLNKVDRLKTSFERYLNTYKNYEFEYKLLDLVVAFEVLFGGGGRDTSTWISLRATKLLGSLTNEKPLAVLNDIRLMYNVRNNYIHKGKISDVAKKQLLSRFLHLQRYLQRSIRCMIFLLLNEKYEKIIIKLDALIEETTIPIDWINVPKKFKDHF